MKLAEMNLGGKGGDSQGNSKQLRRTLAIMRKAFEAQKNAKNVAVEA